MNGAGEGERGEMELEVHKGKRSIRKNLDTKLLGSKVSPTAAATKRLQLLYPFINISS